MSTTITFRVPREIKKKMKRFNINWSDVLRRCVIDTLRALEARENLRRVHERLSKTAGVPKGFATRSVREDRESG